ncbi:hypothetical protein INT47_001372 [Mucor saturninus]|uniref:DUF221-domain-containing protein n=1 Tax=Mucor saturninus TaxID=64648 RepID=A0A8H7UW48_9FUNG|nr:hypothetical protein INT47_001372 [Mucor saturninus]
MSETKESQQGMDSSTHTFTSALWFNAALAVGFFGAFVVLRTTRPQTYAPRTYAVAKEKRPPPIPKGFGRWILALFKISDEDLIKTMGLDRFMVLKFLRMGMVTFSIYSLVAIPILFPINIIGQNSLPGLTYLTMGNVTDDSRTWAHCLLAVILSCLVWYYTFRETKIYIVLRRKFLLSPDYADTVAARTIYVPSIPANINNVEDLEKIFNRFPGGIRRIWLNRQLHDLPELVEKREKAALSLESTVTKAILATYKHNMKLSNKVDEEALNESDIPDAIRPKHRDSVIPLPCFGRKVDSIEFYHNQIKELNHSIGEKQHDAASFTQVNSAFIEFNQQVAAHMAAQSLMHKESMQMAPRYIQIAPSDIIWENMNIKSYERMLRRFVSISITTVIIIFWAVPVVFVQAVANINELAKVLPFLSVINKLGPQVVGIIQGILPAVALSILISLVPVIFTILSTKEGIPQRSFVQLSVLHKFFFFQLIDVVLVSTLSGGILAMIEQIKNIASNPFGIINTLSENLPKASTFFITFVMLQSTNQSGQAMLQLVPYILSYIMPMFATTPRDIYNQKRTCPNVNLGTLIPAQTIIFVLGLEYGVIAPLILPFVCLFFVLQYFVYLYQFLYVYEIPFETAGRAFPRAIRHVYIGLFISQLTLIGLFAIRTGARGQMALMIVTLVCTAFALYYYDRAFKPLFKYLPVSIFEDEDVPDPKKTDAITPDDVHHDDNFQKDAQKSGYASDSSSDHVSEVLVERAPISYEAYRARDELLTRLREEENRSKEEITKDSANIIATAKSLYASESYMHPSTYVSNPTIWIPEDDIGIAQKEIKELNSLDIQGSSRGAAVVRNAKGKGIVTIDEESLINDYQGAPGSAPTAANESNVNNYVRVLVDGYNFGDAITMF